MHVSSLLLYLRYEQPDIFSLYKACPVLDFFADLHNLNVEGYIGMKEIEANWGKSIQMWTRLTVPSVQLRRQEPGRQNVYRLEPLIAKLRRQESIDSPPLIYGSESGQGRA